jgi:hypothetical protein
MFIMTIRNKTRDRQMKFTVENGKYMVRIFRLYPFSDILTSEVSMCRDSFIIAVRENLKAHIPERQRCNVYFNGYNFEKVCGWK